MVAQLPLLHFKDIFLQIVAVVAGTLIAVSDGMHYGWTSPVIPILLGPNSPVQTTKYEAEWLETTIMLGAFSGLPVTIFFVNKIGQRRAIILASFVSLLVWIAIAVANRIEYLYVARFFAGMAGDMAFVAAPMYIAEIADQKIRGFLLSIIYLMMLFGIVLIYSVAPFAPFYVPSIIGGSLALIEMLVFPFMPESPYYLLLHERYEDAKKSLQHFRPNRNIDEELESIAVAVKRQKMEKGRIQDLFLVKSNRKAILIMVLLNGAQHMSSISVILMNLHIILEAAGTVYLTPSTSGIIFSAITFIAGTIASFTVDKYGRKILLIASSLLTGVCLLFIAIYFTLKNSGVDVLSVSWIPIVSVMVYALVFKLGLGMVPIVLTAELFPSKIKAMGMTLSDAIYVTFAIISLQVYQLLADNYGIQVPFYIFSVSCIGTAILTYLFIPETKGKTLEEIQFILKGEQPPTRMENKIERNLE